MKLLIDLFAGRLGWSRAFLERGWRVIAYDLVSPSIEIPACVDYRLRDILTVTPEEIRALRPDWVCCSSPCEEFTAFQMRNFHPDPAYPATGIRLFNHGRELCEAAGCGYTMENVNRAQDFVGRAGAHCGPFYLWGTVPPILPQGINKGFGKMDRAFILKIGSSRSKKRQEHRAKVATIPLELSACVADYAERLLEIEASA